MCKPNSKTLFVLFAAAALFAAACKKKVVPPNPTPDPVDTPQYHSSIIVNSNNQIVYAIDPVTGKKNWELGLPTPMTSTVTVTFAPSPLLYKGRLYIATGVQGNDTLYKINPRTGEIVKKIDVIPSGGNTTFQATPIADAN